MKLLLVNTPIDRQNILGEFNKIYDDLKMVPIGIAYLASNARKNDINVRILDQYAECLSIEEIEKIIHEFSPDLIGYGATTPNFYAAIDLLKTIRNKFPNIPTVMGGQHPSIFPEKTLQYKEIDYVLRDEAEYSLVALCKAIENKNKNLKRIKGLSYKENGKIIHNNPSESVELDKLPWPAYDLLPMQLYSSPSYTRFAMPIVQMSASRGCPNRCTYCINAELNIAAKYRKRDVDDVLDEIEMLIEKYGAKQIQFWDPIFPLGRKHAIEFCNKLIERNLHKKIIWNSTTYAHHLSQELIEVMAKSGCKGIGFGIESGVPELLKSVNKKADLEKVREICRIARKNRIIVAGSFIIGFPGETKEMTRQTINFAKSLDLHYAQFSIMIPYPGTPLYNDLLEKREISISSDDNDYIRFNQSIGLTDLEPVFVPQGRSSNELKLMQKKAYTQFYFRPKTLWLHLPHLRLSLIPHMLKSFFAVIRLWINNFFKIFVKPQTNRSFTKS